MNGERRRQARAGTLFPMRLRRHAPARAETMLLALTLLVSLCGLALTFAGRAVSVPLPARPLNVNAMTATQFASALLVSPDTAQAIVQTRMGRKGHAFGAVYDLRRILHRRGADASVVDTRFVARAPADAARGFWGGVALFVLAFWAGHLALRRFSPRADPFLLSLAAALSALGLMMVYAVKDPYRDSFVFTGQVWGTAIYGLLAFLVPQMPAFGRLSLRRYLYVYAVGSVALMALLIAVGHGPGGVHVSVLGFEPIEFIKVLLVLFVASYLSERGGVSEARDLLPLSALFAGALLLFIVVKDLGPAVLLFGAFLALLYLSTGRARYPLLGTALLALAGWAGYKAHFGFFATRVIMWLAPWHNADPRGSQLADGLWGMATGGVFGSGLGLGQPGLMPRAGSDLIFASLGEELGLVGTVCVLVIYCALLVRGFHIARHARTDFDRLLASGLTLLLGLQTLLITGGMTGLLPLTGITLPFVSFGASSLTADFFSLGLLCAISARAQEANPHAAPPEWERAAKRLLAGMTAFLLVGIGAGRLLWVQGIANSQTASRLLWTPDADGVLRAHVNPRLLQYAAAIPRGRITDRNGAVLARDARPGETGATGLLSPDGHARVYSGGAACGHLLLAVEGARSPTNALGRFDVLRGFGSYPELLSDYRRRWLPFAPRLHGEDVTLTIALPLQQAAFLAVQQAASSVRDRRTGRPKQKGAAVVLDAQTGEALACVSAPSFDPQTLTADSWAALQAGKDGQDALLNRALAGLYPPGSAFKMVTAAAALENGLGGTVVNCPHAVTNVVWRADGHTYSRRRITDEQGFVPHGDTDMAKALRVSCNVYFARLGILLGAKPLLQMGRDGFGLRHLPPLSSLEADLPDCAYGQGAVLTTPAEMASVAQTVANGGSRAPFTLIRDGTRPAPVRALSPANAALLTLMLAAATQPGGTAQGVFDGLPFAVAGKTGSAQNAQGDGETHSWFAGFAPVSRPALAFACVIENGGAGRAAAAPACRNILRAAR